MQTSIKKSSLAVFLIAIAPIFYTYVLPLFNISCGPVVLLVAALMCRKLPSVPLLDRNKRKYYLFFMLYCTIVTCMMTFILKEASVVDASKELMVFLIYSGLLLFFVRKIDIEKFLHIYSDIAFWCAVFLIIQFIVHAATGKWVPGLIPGLMGDEGIPTDRFITYMKRAASFFKEPAHFAHYVAIPFTWELVKKGKKDAFRIWIMMASLFFAFSGNAILVLFIALLGFELSRVNIHRVKWLLFGIGFLVIGGALLFNAYSESIMVQQLVTRLTDGEILGYAKNRSGYIRALRGYVVYYEFGDMEKIFGVGLGNYRSYTEQNFMSLLMEESHKLRGYINGIQYYLCQTGLVGLFLYLFIVFKGMLHYSTFKKIAAFQFLGLLLISGVGRGIYWLLFMMILLGNINRKLEGEA